MSIELKMPALSPTMEEGTLAKWLVKEGDTVSSGDILAEIETDKATMEFEAVDEGKIAKILVPEGSDGVKVGTPIAIMAGEGEERRRGRRSEGRRRAAAAPKAAPEPKADDRRARRPQAPVETPAAPPQPRRTARAQKGDRIKASPLARRLAEAQGIDLSTLTGQRPWRAHRPCRPRAAAGKAPAAAPTGAPPAAPAGARHPCRHARADRAGDPARGDQAVEHAQDDRAPPDGIEAADPAHLPDGRHPARRAAEAARRAQRRVSTAAASSSASTTC